MASIYAYSTKLDRHKYMYPTSLSVCATNGTAALISSNLTTQRFYMQILLRKQPTRVQRVLHWYRKISLLYNCASSTLNPRHDSSRRPLKRII
ncbi:hypothetical protein CANCADRAFT_30240 [Tortispora caseinolytica NRRL Y-17796]|uniref:Uncharacterized protein n=1 Tax=Tortispora caseinolytica NRRL Y-17796 TaxID=767744 RepID=A0A1E4TJW4_9ASCO|nr:hypothetical protein CANCADRAFT_30240 [Tortispora caseinolytica NRRL Y-17796]